MPLMDNLKRGVDVAKFKADQLMRVNRVQGEVSNLRRDIQGVREKIANAVVQLHKQNALAHPELEEMCGTIDQFEAQIAEKEAQIAAIKAEVPPQSPAPASPGYTTPVPTGATAICPNCQASMPVGAAFCTNCGKPLPQPTPTPVSVQPSASIHCPNCGFALPAEAAFCVNCGKPIPKPAATTPAASGQMVEPSMPAPAPVSDSAVDAVTPALSAEPQ